MDQPHIEIFYSATCPLCHKAMAYFDSQDLAYVKHEVVWDAAADAFEDSEASRNLYERAGYKPDFVPQIFVGETHIPGWRTLEPMIESGEFAELLCS
jgi:glutaredoxin